MVANNINRNRIRAVSGLVGEIDGLLSTFDCKVLVRSPTKRSYHRLSSTSEVFFWFSLEVHARKKKIESKLSKLDVKMHTKLCAFALVWSCSTHNSRNSPFPCKTPNQQVRPRDPFQRTIKPDIVPKFDTHSSALPRWVVLFFFVASTNFRGSTF